MACLVCSVSSNLTGRPVFLCRTVARSLNCVAVRCDVLDFNVQHITAAEFAVDRQIEHGKVSRGPAIINRVLIDQTWFGRSGGFAPINLPLFQGVRREAVQRLDSSGMVVLLNFRG